jgi:hypothetical protein
MGRLDFSFLVCGRWALGFAFLLGGLGAFAAGGCAPEAGSALTLEPALLDLESEDASGLRPGFKIGLVAGPSSALADSSASIAVTATVTDSMGNPMTGAPITFSASGSANDVFFPPSSVTNCKGVARVNISANAPGIQTVTATFSRTSAATSISFTCPGPFLAPIGWPTVSLVGVAAFAVGDLDKDGNVDLLVPADAANQISIVLGNGDGKFKPAVNYSASTPSAVAACDLNNDGILDMISSNGPGSTVLTWMGLGNGSFLPSRSATTAVIYPQEISCVDLNKDGNLDILVGHGSTATSFTTMLGNGDGTLQTEVSYAAISGPRNVSPGDFNGDGWPDVAVSNGGGNFLTTYLNNGSGALTRRVDYAAISPLHVEVADVNNDGILDMISTTGADPTSLISYVGVGNGNFTLAGTVSTLRTTIGLGMGDLNQDGNLDVLVAGYGSFAFGYHLGRGDGTFGALTWYSANAPAYIKAVDINNDGYPDALSPSSVQLTQAFSVFLNTANGTGSFVSAPNLTASSYVPYRLSMGKYSADSLALLAYSVTAANTLDVRRSNGNGTFTAGTSLGSLNSPQEVVITDLNNDNKADVAIVLGVSSNTNNLYVYLGNGDGTLQTPTFTASGNTPLNLAAVDLNKDGNVDLVVSNSVANTVAVLLGNGGGGLAAPLPYAVGSSPRSVAVADINGDTNVDVVVANSGTNTMSLLLGNGDGTLQNAVSVVVGTTPVTTALADLNGDGRTDFVSSLNTQGSPGQGISVLLGNNSTTPASAVYYAAGGAPWSLSLGDVNGDGKTDAVVANSGDTTLSILLGNGDGTFMAASTVDSGSTAPATVLLRDVNGDGRLDALVGSLNGRNRTIPLLLGSGCNASASSAANNTNNLLTYSSSTVDVAGAAELTPSNSDNPVNAFAGATLTGTAWDANALSMRLGSNGGCSATTTNCASLDPSWTPQYANLTGYWPLDGAGTLTAGTTIAGTIGGNLTVTSASATYEKGQIGQGLNVGANGNAYLVLPATNNPNNLPFTVMGWTKWNGGADNSHLFTFGQNNNYLTMGPNTGGAVITYTQTAGVGTRFNGVTPFPVGSWQHFAATVTSSGFIIYVNGGAYLTVTTPITPNMVVWTSNSFGSTNPAFTGVYDELAMFNVVLNPNQVQQIYNRQSALYSGSAVSRVLGPQSTTPTWSKLAWSSTSPTLKPLPSAGISEPTSAYPSMGTTSLGTGLSLLWHLDETATATAPGARDARDDSGQGNHGKIYNAVSLGQPGVMNNAYTFDGVSSTVSSLYQQYNPMQVSISVWFNTQTTSGGKLVGFGSSTSGASGNYDRHLYIDNTNRARFGVLTETGSPIGTVNVVNDGRWHHLVGVQGTGGIYLYLDGSLQPSANTGTGQVFSGYWRVGGDNLTSWYNTPSSHYFQGRIDEVAVYNRSLSPTEVQQLWRRGANRLKFQIRACTSMTCADNPGWLGPDGSTYTYFSELGNLATNGNVLSSPPDLLFAASPGLSLPNNPYFQYKVIMESDDANNLCTYNGAAAPCSPELLSVRAGPFTYPLTGTLTSTSGSTMHGLSSLVPTYGPGGCPAGVGFNLSNNGGTNWYWWNGYLWAPANGTPTQSNTPAQLTSAILGAFVPQKGPGPITYRAFLNSTGTTPCSLAGVSLNGVP